MQRFQMNYGFELGNESAISEINYDWSDVSVADDTFQADGFFGERHLEHERNNGACPAIRFETTQDEEFNHNITNEENDENNQNTQNLRTVDSVDSSNISSDLEEIHIETVATNEAEDVKPNDQKKPNASNKSKVPQVYYRAELTKKRHALRALQREREDRKKREFHAKKVPNFKKAHEANAVKNHRTEDEKLNQLTIPVTPKVVHHHIQNMERVKVKRLEYEEPHKPKPFISKEPEVLFKEPFVPAKQIKQPTALVPFNLHIEDRLQKRHEFDERIKIEMERKERETKELKRAHDEIIRRELRKQATFKANPNPFSQSQ